MALRSGLRCNMQHAQAGAQDVPAQRRLSSRLSRGNDNIEVQIQMFTAVRVILRMRSILRLRVRSRLSLRSRLDRDSKITRVRTSRFKVEIETDIEIEIEIATGTQQLQAGVHG